jgi:hypothetical protein
VKKGICTPEQAVSALRTAGRDPEKLEHVAGLWDEAKERARDPAWLWNGIVRFHLTRGGSKNYDRWFSRCGGEPLDYDLLGQLPFEQRMAMYLKVAGRFRNQKADALEASRLRIAEYGGPEQAGRYCQSLGSTTEKLNFLSQFPYIGPKGARNILMDVADQDAQEVIAVDLRVHAMVDCIKGAPPKSNYLAREAYLIELGAQAGIHSAWKLDRLVYSFHADIIADMTGVRRKYRRAHQCPDSGAPTGY